MKTILEWLNEAKEQGYDWAEAAINNYIRQWAYSSPKNKVNSLVRSLEVAFVWSDSPEKEEFWHGVSESLRAAEEGDSTLIEYLIKDLGKLNSALENLAYNDALKEPYRTQVYDATKASYEEQLDEVKSEIAKNLGIEPPKERKLIGWVAADQDGNFWQYYKPKKGSVAWGFRIRNITPEQAAALCYRLPQWNDDEPTPIYE